MVILGFALKSLVPVLKFVGMAAAPVVAVLAWGAVEDVIDKRRNTNKDDATSS
jgi:hypothetical protein